MSVKVANERYNNIQRRISAILGISQSGSPTTGYGETVNSDIHYPLTESNKITANQYEDLYVDIVRARIHQIGAANFSVDPFVVGNYSVNQSNTDKIEETYISSLESLMTTIETDKFLLDISQATIENIDNQTYSNWNNTVTHSITLSFLSDSERRHFFNSGGEIRFNANNNYTGTDLKTNEWKTMFSEMGNISFDHTETFSNNNSGISSSIGNYDLTSSFQIVYQKLASTYNGNEYTILARENSSTQIEFQIQFSDNNTGNIDENVLGITTSSVDTLTADGIAVINNTTYTTVSNTPPTVV